MLLMWCSSNLINIQEKYEITVFLRRVFHIIILLHYSICMFYLFLIYWYKSFAVVVNLISKAVSLIYENKFSSMIQTSVLIISRKRVHCNVNVLIHLLLLGKGEIRDLNTEFLKHLTEIDKLDFDKIIFAYCWSLVWKLWYYFMLCLLASGNCLFLKWISGRSMPPLPGATTSTSITRTGWLTLQGLMIFFVNLSLILQTFELTWNESFWKDTCLIDRKDDQALWIEPQHYVMVTYIR